MCIYTCKLSALPAVLVCLLIFLLVFQLPHCHHLSQYLFRHELLCACPRLPVPAAHSIHVMRELRALSVCQKIDMCLQAHACTLNPTHVRECVRPCVLSMQCEHSHQSICLCSSVPQVAIPSSVHQEETEAAPNTSYHITSIAPAPNKCNEVCMPFYLSVKELCTHTLAHVCTCFQELTELLSQAISIKLTIPTYICPRALLNATSLPANRATTAARHAASACTL